MLTPRSVVPSRGHCRGRAVLNTGQPCQRPGVTPACLFDCERVGRRADSAWHVERRRREEKIVAPVVPRNLPPAPPGSTSRLSASRRTPACGNEETPFLARGFRQRLERRRIRRDRRQMIVPQPSRRAFAALDSRHDRLPRQLRLNLFARRQVELRPSDPNQQDVAGAQRDAFCPRAWPARRRAESTWPW